MAEQKILELCALQLILDASIQEKKKPDLNKEALFDNTLVALMVELAEFANEGRWFKFWSEDQQPRTKVQDGYELNVSMLPEIGFDLDKPVYINLLLEEYVDCLHFFLSLANQKGWRHELNLLDGSPAKAYDAAPFVINHTYLRLISHLSNTYLHRERIHFAAAWESFLIIGIRIFGLSWDEIEKAYHDKNATNHERQQSGY